jgi:hypothetical protein
MPASIDHLLAAESAITTQPDGRGWLLRRRQAADRSEGGRCEIDQGAESPALKRVVQYRRNTDSFLVSMVPQCKMK